MWTSFDTSKPPRFCSRVVRVCSIVRDFVCVFFLVYKSVVENQLNFFTKSTRTERNHPFETMLPKANRPFYGWSLLAIELGIVLVFAATASTVRAGDSKPLDDYVVAAQSECFTSKRILSCFRYKAARYLWSAASGRMNWFDKDNSRTLMAADRASGGSSSDPPVQSSFRFVQLSEPSTALVFPGARQEMGMLHAPQIRKDG